MLLALSEESASVPAFFVSSDDLGSFPGTIPLASGESVETSGVGGASLALSDESSDNSGSLERELASWSKKLSDSADVSLSLLVLLELADASSSSDGLEGSPAHVPADVSSGLSFLVGGASSAVSLEVSNGSGSLPVSDPGASGPLVSASSVGNTVLAGSLPSSDDSSSQGSSGASGVLSSSSLVDGASSSVLDESSDDSSSPVHADGLGSLSESEDLASLTSSHELSDDLSSGPGTSPDASSPLHSSSSVDRAVLSSESVLSDGLSSGESSDGNPLSDLVRHDSGLSSSSDEFSDNSGVHVPADSSGLVGLLPDGAGVLSLLESSDDSSTSPPSEPLAGSPLSHASLLLGASLSLSHPGSDGLAPGTSSESSSHGASGPSLGSSGPGGAGSSSSVPLSDDSSSSEVPSATLASGPGSVASLVDGAKSVVSLESSDD